jgi:NDP-sugar pyrophosphorylase family protein
VIPALVLTAGLATRLRPLSLVRAKAALPVAGEPLVRRILGQLHRSGVTRAVLNLHHKPESVARAVGDGTDVGVRVRYSWESPAVLGSAGGPRHALSLIDSGTFLIVNGDTLTDVDLGAMLEQHRRQQALVTMALVRNTEPHKYGGARLDAHGSVTGFVARGSTDPSYHFVGVQIAEASAFAPLADNEPYESVAALYPALITSSPHSVRGFVSEAAFMDIGTPADYLDTSLSIAAREGRTTVGARTSIAPGARLERSILWDDVNVGEGAYLHECIVTDGVQVPADTSWRGVTMRRWTGELTPGEKRIGNLAIASI